jgi:diguanylate cyclase (GGDEF)-like protein
LFGLALPALWLLYAHEQIFRNAVLLWRLAWPLILLNAVNALILIMTQFNGWYYTIDDHNIYHRGPLFWFPVAATAALLFIVFVMVGLNRKTIDRKHYYPLLLFIVPPMAGMLLQLMFYGASFMLNSIVLSLLIVFLNIQNQDVYTDYLTGINNRKKLDLYMFDKIRACSAQRTFSAVLLDIDDFKIINDTFGHDTGDEALESAAALLSNCLRTNDFIARFGGDEFMIVLDISGSRQLETAVERIRESVRQYNESSKKPYKLEFSMGYAVFDNAAGMKLAEFQKLLDTLMYEDKRDGKTALPN